MLMAWLQASDNSRTSDERSRHLASQPIQYLNPHPSPIFHSCCSHTMHVTWCNLPSSAVSDRSSGFTRDAIQMSRYLASYARSARHVLSLRATLGLGFPLRVGKLALSISQIPFTDRHGGGRLVVNLSLSYVWRAALYRIARAEQMKRAPDAAGVPVTQRTDRAVLHPVA